MKLTIFLVIFTIFLSCDIKETETDCQFGSGCASAYTDVHGIAFSSHYMVGHKKFGIMKGTAWTQQNYGF
jgi:hypothetical protein